MASIVTINTFSGLAPPWSLTQLDTGLTGLRDAIQSQNTFSNFAVDTGVANAYVTTPAAGITAALTAGLLLQFKAANANTGASTLNHAGLGAKNIFNIDGSALVANQIPLNGIVQVVYDGTQFFLANTSVVLPYTTGTWTPSVGGSATYLTQTGTFTKVGNSCRIQCDLQINAIGTGSTTLISGLPFVSATVGGQPLACKFSNALATAVVSLVGNIQNGSSTIQFLGLTAAAAFMSSITVFQNATALSVSGVYQTA